VLQPLLLSVKNKDITSTRRPIIYPNWKIIAHENRYVKNEPRRFKQWVKIKRRISKKYY